MKDFSQLLLNKTNEILEQWVEAVQQDQQVESANNLPYMAVRNHLPDVLRAMATVLSQDEESDVQSVVEASLEHGVVRAEQGFEPAEIAREYCLLRRTIFSTLEQGMLAGTPAEVMRAFRLIDAVIDEATARCFKSYIDERLRELQQLQNQLTLNNQELTRLVRDNQESLSYLAHELRTPLTSIIGYADLFLRQQAQKLDTKDTSANLGHIERVLYSGRQLLHLINDALEISRYEAGKMQLQLAATDMRSVIFNVLEVMEPLARAKELKLVFDIERAPQQVISDSLRLQQVVTNLVSNAIRYTKSGTIELTCQVLGDDQWAIAVADTGIGIALENQKHIFEPYFQVGVSATYPPDSTGLGLAIVSRLVKLLQGKIQLVSQAGVGSTFTVIFPLVIKTTEAAALSN